LRITLISLDDELFVSNIRILSSCLRQRGHQVTLIFLPSTTKSEKSPVMYSESVLSELVSMCADNGLIGFSLVTNQFRQASYVTKYLKKNLNAIPVVWGGIHPTVEPEVCLEIADIVCVGEGEEAIVELVERMEQKLPYHNVQNLYFKSQGKIIRNSLRPLIQDLDKVPLPDYSFTDHFLARRNHIVKLTPELVVSHQGAQYSSITKGMHYITMTSRGCVFACTYCCNNVYHRLYPGQKRLRWRSFSKVIEEIKLVIKHLASISLVLFVDDNFTSRSEQELKIFCESFKKEIGLPYFAQVSPLSINDRKMEILLDSGCVTVVLGIETGNERIARMYGREKMQPYVYKAISIIERYRKRLQMPPSYHFIIDNPYEKIDELIETLQLAIALPRPRNNGIFTLMLFPGTILYEKAFADGLIDKSDLYGRNLHTHRPFFKFWLNQYHANRYPLLLRILLAPSIVRILTSKHADRIMRLRGFRLFWDY